MNKRAASLATALLVLLSGTALADSPTILSYMPERPQISGTIVTVNDRQIVLHASDGQRVSLAYDSHSVVPSHLADGMLMSAEFRVMDNGSYYAQRVVPAEPRNGASSTLRSSDGVTPAAATDVPASRTSEAASATRAEAWVAYNEAAAPADAAPGQGNLAGERAAGAPRESYSEGALPQTASNQTLIGLLGLALVSAAGALAILRSRLEV